MTRDDGEIRQAMNRAKRGLLAEAHTLKMMGLNRPPELGKSFQNMLVSDEAVRKLADAQNMVPDELALGCIAVGNPGHVTERIAEYSKAGATRALIHFVKEGNGQIEEFAEKVLPHFGE